MATANGIPRRTGRVWYPPARSPSTSRSVPTRLDMVSCSQNAAISVISAATVDETGRPAAGPIPAASAP